MGLAKKVRYMKSIWTVKERRRRCDLQVLLPTLGSVIKEMDNYNASLVSSLSGLIEP